MKSKDNEVDGCRVSTFVKRWDRFTPVDIARASLLTNHPADLAKSVMRRWLDLFRSGHGLKWFYGAFVRLDEDVVGWAAANLRHDQERGLAVIGVYIHPDCRRKGLAQVAVQALLAHLYILPREERPVAICYQDNMRRFFNPLIRAAGFRDGIADHAR